MPSEVLVAIIAAASAVGGSVVGASATLLAGWFQRKNERVKAVREKSGQAAHRCASLINQVAKDITRTAAATRGSPAISECHERIEQALPKINAAALYLPEPLRGRIKEAAEILYECEGVSCAHYSSIWTISSTVRDEVIAMVATFLQEKKRKDCLAKLSELMLEYRVALQDNEAFYIEEREMTGPTPDDLDYRRKRERFYNRHPKPFSTEGNS